MRAMNVHVDHKMIAIRYEQVAQEWREIVQLKLFFKEKLWDVISEKKENKEQ